MGKVLIENFIKKGTPSFSAKFFSTFSTLAGDSRWPQRQTQKTQTDRQTDMKKSSGHWSAYCSKFRCSQVHPMTHGPPHSDSFIIFITFLVLWVPSVKERPIAVSLFIIKFELEIFICQTRCTYHFHITKHRYMKTLCFVQYVGLFFLKMDLSNRVIESFEATH